jgi:teichuronic acid biosynthesis glycosyltransferase TuaG
VRHDTETIDSDNNVVSVIMPSFNSDQTVSRAIDSVISQTYPYWELIVCDDASSDRTVDVVGRYQLNESRIRLLVSETNGGPGVARNRGIAAAQGRYVAFLDADDEWDPRKLELQVNLLQMDSHIAACCTSYDVVTGPHGARRLQMFMPRIVTYRMLHYHDFIGCLTAIYDTTRTAGKVFMPEIRQRQDWGLWLRITARSGPFLVIQQSLATLHRDQQSMTSNKMKSSKYTAQMLKEELNFGTVRAILYTLVHNAIAFVRLLISRVRRKRITP